MRTIHRYLFIILIGVVACNPLELDEIQDPNNPSVQSVEKNATRSQLQFVITGLESRHRRYSTIVSQAFNVFGREIWYINASDPRFQSQWLGRKIAEPTRDFFQFGTTGAAGYAYPYQAIRQAGVLFNAANNTTAVTAEERNAVAGFAKTIMGYQFMIPANFVYGNGIRIDVSNPVSPGGYVDYAQALDHARKLLDEGYQSLVEAGAPGSAFPFTLTSGFTSFNTLDGLMKVNRAIAARVNIYRKDWQAALDALKGSFIDTKGNLDLGPAHPYDAETPNPFYFVANANVTTIIVPHPSVLKDTIAGDLRVKKKFLKRTAPLSVTSDAFTFVGTHQDKRWASNVTSVPFIRNEELILIKAEAHAQLNQFADAEAAINVVRVAAGIGNYAGVLTKEALINEILYQRRYSLWAEPWGHRWIDARRYNRLNEIPTNHDEGVIFVQFPHPQADVSWDTYAGN